MSKRTTTKWIIQDRQIDETVDLLNALQKAAFTVIIP